MELKKLESLTMSGREIATLTGKEHKNVKRDVEVMIKDIGGDALKFERIYKDSVNRDHTEYLLPKREDPFELLAEVSGD